MRVNVLVGLLLVVFASAAQAVELPLEAESFKLGKGWTVSDGGYFPSQPNLWSGTKIVADETDSPAAATKTVEVPQAGTYNLWVRYESAYGFGSRFAVKIIQHQKTVLDAPFGGTQEKKYFPFGRGFRVQGPWDWHNTDYVYQGASVSLEKGAAQIIISKGANEQPAARRTIDLLYLTDDLKITPGDDWNWDKDGPPILSRFKVPLYVRCRVDQGQGALQVTTSFYLIGYYKGPRGTYHLSKAGLTAAVPPTGQWLKADETTDWQRIDVASAMLPVLDLTPLGGGTLTVDVAAFTPDNIVKTLTLGPDKKTTELIVAIGKAKYERGLLGDNKALTIDEIWRKQTALVDAVKVEGTPATKILLASPLSQPLDLEFAMARACGLNAQYYDANPAIYGVNATLRGFNTDMGFGSQQNSFMTRQCYEGEFAALDGAYRRAAAEQKRTLGRDLPVHIKLIEEAGSPAIETLLGYPPVKARFVQYLAEQHLTLEQAQADKAAWHYHSNYFRCLLFARTSAEATRLIEKYFPPGTRTNSGSFYPSTGAGPGMARGDDCFTLFKERGATEFCSEMTWGLGGTPDYIGPESESYQGTLARALAKYHDATMGTYVISDGNRGYTGDYVELASYALLSHGLSWLGYYQLSYPSECSFLGYPDVHAGIKRVSYSVGRVEKDLTAAKVRPARIALGWSLTTDIWDLADPGNIELGPGNTVYPQERHNLYLMLRHLQYPVDILSEDDVASGAMKDYQVYVLVGDHLLPKAAEQLKAWVAGGGTLVSVAGGGLLDQYNKPLATLNEVFGIKSATLEKTVPTLRPKLELVHAKPLDTITFAAGGSMDAFGYRQHFTPAPAPAPGPGAGKVIGTYANGEAAAVANSYGKGHAVIIGTLPGAAYLKPAIPMRPFGRGGQGELSQFVPTNFAKGVAAVFAAQLGPVVRPAVCSNPLVEANVLMAADRYVITLVNYANAPLESLTVRLDSAELGPLGEAKASFADAQVTRRDGSGIELVIPRLDKWEVLVVGRK